jgi:hypothetical protein
MDLLTTNAKLEKTPASDTRYLIAGLSLAPHAQAGRNVCPWAGFCAAVCVLWFAGRTVMRNVREAMIRRAKWYWGDRAGFLAALVADVAALVRKADRAGAVAVVRLNVASDIVWERIAPELFARFPGVVWYDYTKAPPRSRPTTPSNYYLTHSVHEKTTLDDVRQAFALGRNVAAVFDSVYYAQKKRYGALPARVTFTNPAGESLTVDTVCGDLDDLRIPERDGRGRCVALAGKGGRKRIAEAVAAGFAHHAPGGSVVRSAPWLDGEAVVTLIA